MQHLKFLGNGSGFTDNHNNAYFEDNGNIYFIDLSMLNMYKALALHPENYNNIFIIITHMHDDHSTGLGLFIQHMFYTKNKKVYIVAPYNIQSDIATDLINIRGIDLESFDIILPENMKDRFGLAIKSIKTTHAPELLNKCFGYVFELDNTKIVYTGDTNNLNDFKPFLDGKCEFYVDISMCYGKVHILFSDVKDELIALADIIDIYMMHIDNMEKAEEAIKNTMLHIART